MTRSRHLIRFAAQAATIAALALPLLGVAALRLLGAAVVARTQAGVLQHFGGISGIDRDPSTGTWYILKSSSAYTTSLSFVLGGGTDMPMPGDYDGDGTTDLGAYHRATGTWTILQSSTNFTTSLTITLGTSADRPTSYVTVLNTTLIPTDVTRASNYDGDKKSDVAVYRPSTGGWSILKSSSM